MSQGIGIKVKHLMYETKPISISEYLTYQQVNLDRSDNSLKLCK